MTNLKLSYSGSNAYKHCPRLYKLHYVDKIRGLKVRSFLPFGGAIDKTLNYILESIRDGKTYENWENVFKEAWSTTEIAGQQFDTSNCGYIEFLESDTDETWLSEEELMMSANMRAYLSLQRKGLTMIQTYIKEFVPKLDKVLEVQMETKLESQDGTKLVGIVDFVAKLKDIEEPILFDNKTASQKYPKNAVLKSEQLSSYCYASGLKKAGFVVITKKFPKGDKPVIQILIDNIDPAVEESTIEYLTNTAHNIKCGNFQPNFGSACNSYFGSKCPYYNLCRNGSMDNLIEVKK